MNQQERHGAYKMGWSEIKDQAGYDEWQEMADDLDISPSYLSRIVNGDRDVPVSLIKKLARKIGMSPGELLDELIE